MNNVQKVIKFQLAEYKLAIIIFYIASFGMISMMAMSVARSSVSGNGVEESTISGLEVGAVIFLFILALSTFSETFKMMLQKGIARKIMFKGFLITTMILSVGMTLINEIILFTGGQLSSSQGNIILNGLFEQIYGVRYAQNSGGPQMAIEGMLFLICLLATSMALGYLITTIFYRINVYAKVAVAVSVPVLGIVVVPILDYFLTGGVILGAIGNFILFSLGIKNGYNPYYGMISLIIAYCFFTALSWAIVRRAVIK